MVEALPLHYQGEMTLPLLQIGTNAALEKKN